MTNTLHRYGNAASFRDDFIVFAIACKGKNDEGAVERLRTFLDVCSRHGPVSLGNSEVGSHRPAGQLRPLVHWARDLAPDHDAVVESVRKRATVAAVFDSATRAEACLRELIDVDLGLSVNVATSVDGAKAVAEGCGIQRHSVEYSLDTTDPQNLLPDAQVLHLSTMCGHGMVSANLAKKMLDMVREGRRTAEQAAVTLSRFCSCGVYNPVRAKRLMEEATGQRPDRETLEPS